MNNLVKSIAVVSIMMSVVGCWGLRGSSSGPVAYYKFDGNAQDSSGNENHACEITAKLTSDRFGNIDSAYEFGRGRMIKIPDSDSLKSVTNAVSVTVWVKTGRYTNGWEPILCKSESNLTCFIFGLFRWLPNGGELECKYNLSCGDHSVETSPNSILPPKNEWHHVAATFDGKEIRAYLDGELAGFRKSDDFKIPMSSDPLYIGMDRPGLVEYFNGAMDDLIIFNRALSKDEIIGLMNAVSP